MAKPVVGYSIAYPFGVLGMILAIGLAQRWWRPDYAAEARQLRNLGAVGEELITQTVRITNPAILGSTIAALLQREPRRVIVTRHKRNGTITLAQGDTQLYCTAAHKVTYLHLKKCYFMAPLRIQANDVINLVGLAEDVNAIVALVGAAEAEPMALM